MDEQTFQGSVAMRKNPWVIHVIELLFLLAGMFLLAAWMKPGLGGDLFNLTGNPCTSSALEGVIAGGLFFAILTLPVLMLVRYVPNSLIVIAGSTVWIVAVYGYIYVTRVLPVVREIREADKFHLFDNTLMLDAWHIPMRIWLWALVSVLGGLYAVRRRFSYLKLVVGVLVVSYLFRFLFTPFAGWPQWWLAPVCFAAFAALLVTLPVQRTALERLIGISLRKGEAVALPQYAPVSALAGHLVLVLIALGIAGSAAINYFERAQLDVLTNGSLPKWHSPSERNAYDFMKAHFVKGTEAGSLTGSNHPDDYEDALKLISQISTGTREQIFSEINVNTLNSYIAELGDYIQSFEAASNADYLQMPGNEFPSFLNLRETARAIAIRGQLALRKGDAEAAVTDVGTLYRMGGLLRDQPTLVVQMIGAAIRNMANQSAWSMIAAEPDNPDLLAALAAALEDVSGQNRVSLDFRAIQEGEPGLLRGAINPAVSITVPAFARAHLDTLLKWMNFDLVQISTALERFRLEHGSYPTALQELTPRYLERIPREPIEGREYGYALASAERYELYNPTDRDAITKRYDALAMAPMFAEDSDEATTQTH